MPHETHLIDDLFFIIECDSIYYWFQIHFIVIYYYFIAQIKYKRIALSVSLLIVNFIWYAGSLMIPTISINVRQKNK